MLRMIAFEVTRSLRVAKAASEETEYLAGPDLERFR